MALVIGDALLGTGMAGAIYTAMQGVTGFQTSLSGQQFANAIATAVVNQIKTTAIVTVTSVSGVTTGPGVSGPGLGTVGLWPLTSGSTCRVSATSTRGCAR